MKPLSIAVTVVSLTLAGVLVGPQLSAQAAEVRAPLASLDMDVATYATQFTGDPYAWGGTSPAGFDCSGLTQYLYAAFGYQIPRDAADQAAYFRPVSEADAEPGDLVFFSSGGYVFHVGVYEGDGIMISALNYGLGVMKSPLSWGEGFITFGTITH